MIHRPDHSKASRIEGSPWFESARACRNGALKLFCFPYAGGTAQLYAGWHQYFQPEVCIRACHLPGRERRAAEAPFRNIHLLVGSLADAIEPEISQPFALLGHSMGALVAFELARLLRRRLGIEPVHLLLSGRSAPDLPPFLSANYNLPDDEFIAELRRLQGTPEELLNNPSAMEFLMPLIRADFEAVQTYSYHEDEPLSCAMTVYGGLGDESTPVERLQPWRRQTAGRFMLRMLPGNHFFIQNSPLQMIRIVKQDVLADPHGLSNRDRAARCSGTERAI